MGIPRTVQFFLIALFVCVCIPGSGVNEIIQLDQPPLPMLPPPSCVLTASPSSITMTTTAYLAGVPSSTITLTIPPSSTPVDSATLYERDFNIPYNIPPGGEICGGGNPQTVGFQNNPGYRVIAFWSPVGPSQSQNASIPGQSSVFQANIVGPGGPASCTTTVTTSCAGTMTNDVDWTDPTGTYASFLFNGNAYFQTNNDPPYCTWSLCQVDGYGNPWPGCCGNRGYMPGCFAPGTKILMADGSRRTAGRIVAGDRIWNPLKRKSVRVRKVIWGPEKPALVELGFGGFRVRVTTKHPMLTRVGIKAASAVTRSDFLLGEDGRYHRVSALRRPAVNPRQLVYNFELETPSPDPDEHCLVADGILTGDYFLQASLEKGGLP